MLKEFTYQYILLHDNLTKDEKIQIGTFVKEASDEQVMSLLLTGECKDSLEEGEGEFTRELFEVSPVSIILKEQELLQEVGSELIRGLVTGLAHKWASYKVPDTSGEYAAYKIGQWGKNYNQAIDAINKGTPVAATVVATLILLVSYKLYKSYLSKAAKACKAQPTPESKKSCMNKYKIEALKAQIKELTAGKVACKGSKNPQKCITKVDNKIHAVQVLLQKASRKK